LYSAKGLLVLNPTGGIFFRSVEPIVILRLNNNVLHAIVVSDAPISTVKQVLVFFKIQLLKQLAVFARGYKKQVAVKGLGYRAEFFVLKNRQFLNFKITYSHKVAIPIHFGCFFMCLKTNVVLFESKDQKNLSSILSLLFLLKPYSVYKQKGVFFRQAPLFIPKPSKKKV
jgi:ribosomal protein L6P/L9E